MLGQRPALPWLQAWSEPGMWLNELPCASCAAVAICACPAHMMDAWGAEKPTSPPRLRKLVQVALGLSQAVGGHLCSAATR